MSSGQFSNYDKLIYKHDVIIYDHLKLYNYKANFHLHNLFEIYFFISGDVRYFIENKVYDLKYGDMLVLNSNEIHKPTVLSANCYERIVIHFDPFIVQAFNSPTFNLLKCFTDRGKGEQNKIHLNGHQIEEMLKMLNRIEELNGDSQRGSEILRLTYMIELLVYINTIFSNTKAPKESVGVNERLVPVLEYIDKNLSEDLSLDTLGKVFYINGVYLNRLFKKLTGSSIHSYIIYKRISLAKRLLLDGDTVTDACMKSGFNDYSNFTRMFKKTVGKTPKEFKK